MLLNVFKARNEDQKVILY